MRITLSTPRQMHAMLAARLLLDEGHDVSLYTSTPRKRLRGDSTGLRHHLQPKLTEIYTQITQTRINVPLDSLDGQLYDYSVATRLGFGAPPDIFYGWAGVSLASGQAAHARGGKFALDRACPFVTYQEDLVLAEAEKVGFRARRRPVWCEHRQLAEYEEADAILVPSGYSGGTFPQRLQPKIICAPLWGRVKAPESVPVKDPNRPFTVGVVGGDAIRKGYLYLLRAWKNLGLKNAQLLLRYGAGFKEYPVLDDLMRSLPNVEQVRYVPDISDFYNRCDVFVLPSVDDGFGMVIFEAMAHGLPTIATTHCGASELAVNGSEALIVPPFREDALAEALLRLYQSPALRRQLGDNGRLRAEHLQQAGPRGLYGQGIHEMLRRLGPAGQQVSESASQQAGARGHV